MPPVAIVIESNEEAGKAREPGQRIHRRFDFDWRARVGNEIHETDVSRFFLYLHLKVISDEGHAIDAKGFTIWPKGHHILVFWIKWIGESRFRSGIF